jgi:hypothetical protein
MASFSSSLHLVKSTFVFKFLWLMVQHEGDKVIVFERAVLFLVLFFLIPLEPSLDIQFPPYK